MVLELRTFTLLGNNHQFLAIYYDHWIEFAFLRRCFLSLSPFDTDSKGPIISRQVVVWPNSIFQWHVRKSIDSMNTKTIYWEFNQFIRNELQLGMSAGCLSCTPSLLCIILHISCLRKFTASINCSFYQKHATQVQTLTPKTEKEHQ